jgi:hypothetical protein
MRNLAMAASRLEWVLEMPPNFEGGQSMRRGESLPMRIAR